MKMKAYKAMYINDSEFFISAAIGYLPISLVIH